MNIENGVDCVGVSVIFFCHDGKGNFVMSKRGQNARDEHGKWDIGGGALDFDKTVEQTLREEIQSEYNTSVLAFSFLGLEDVFREKDGHPTHWLALFYSVLIDPTTVKNGEPHKFDDVRWFTFDTLPPESELHSQFPVFLKKYEAMLP